MIQPSHRTHCGESHPNATMRASICGGVAKRRMNPEELPEIFIVASASWPEYSTCQRLTHRSIARRAEIIESLPYTFAEKASATYSRCREHQKIKNEASMITTI